MAGKTLRNPEDAEQEEQHRGHDESELDEKILVHKKSFVSSFRF
jgi:hypothetical protein